MTARSSRGGLVITASDEIARRRADRGRAGRRARGARRPSPGLDRRHGHRRHRQVRHPRRRRRAHPHGAAVRRHLRLRHLRDRHPGRGLGRHDHDRRLRRAVDGRVAARGPGRLARQGRGQLRHRLRLPHDHRRRQRGLAEGDGPPGRRGHHQLQAVHGLPGRLLQRRRADPARDAEGRRQRRADHDARRERHRDRRAGRAGARPRADRPALPRRGAPRAAGGRGHPPGDQAGPGRGRAALHRPPVGDGGAGRGGRGPRRGLQRVRRDLPAVPVPVHRRPGAARTSRAPSTSAPRRCGRAEHQAALWRGLRTNDLSVVSTDHCPFCFKGQKELGLGDFSKIPNGLPGVEHRMDLLHQGVVDGHISPPALDRDRLRHAGPDVRALPAQGHDRAGLRRRRRHLRPERDAGALGVDAPHERRLLVLRGQARSPAGSTPCSPAGGWSSTAASTRRGRATAGSCAATPASTC